MKNIKLFCFPYAGGSAAIYNKWRKYLHKNIVLCPVELAGRGKRINEDLYEILDNAVEDVYQIVKGDLHGYEYAFFGHSMGGIIAYELAMKCLSNGYRSPIHLFFSGRGAPHIQKIDKRIFHTMPEEEFRKEVLELGGTPKDFFEYPELLEIMMPMLRNDFRIVEKYEHTKRDILFNCDITVLIGKKEKVSAEQLHGWKDVTKKICSVHYFEGDHFFILQETENILTIINNTLKQKILDGMVHTINYC